MNDNTAIVVICVGIPLAIAIGSGITAMAETPVAIEAAKAGLQQCPTENGLAWQKECKK
jgi:hypothetical protein